MRIEQEKVQPTGMAVRVLPRLIYGAGPRVRQSPDRLGHDRIHGPTDPARTWSGSTRPGSSRTTRPWSWWATPRWPRCSRGWRSCSAPGSPARYRPRTSPTVALPPKPVIYVIDRPDSIQSVILAGHVDPAQGQSGRTGDREHERGSRRRLHVADQHEHPRGQALVLRSRLVPADARGQRPFIVYAPVQTDKSRRRIEELRASPRGKERRLLLRGASARGAGSGLGNGHGRPRGSRRVERRPHVCQRAPARAPRGRALG